ncbi:hypothetical protein [Salinarimonas sp.]|uniref:hypothetical protein n=1 Tax=Salinarimonas sp. TaxID=2766526 RepID=UPI0032D8BBF1
MWSQIASLGDAHCYVLGGGLAISLAMMESGCLKPKIFVEFHLQNDANALLRNRESDVQINFGLRSSDQPECIVVVDKVYSGGSLRLAAERMSKLYPAARVIKVGLFPKSLEGVESCDYVVFGGALLDVSYFDGRSGGPWHYALWRKANQ